MEEVNELVEVADAVRHQFASADDAAKLAAAAAVSPPTTRGAVTTAGGMGGAEGEGEEEGME